MAFIGGVPVCYSDEWGCLEIQTGFQYRQVEYDRQFKAVFDAIRELLFPPVLPKKRRIGFHARSDD